MNLKRNEIDRLIDNAFLVLKKEAFYDNHSQINKEKISVFESDGYFNQKIKKLKDEIYHSLDNNSIQDNFFNLLINKVDFYPVLKKQSNEESNMWTLNFYIDLPIELQIIDYAWSLLIVMNKETYENCEHLYANKFDENIKNKNSFKDDFDKKLLFKRYKYGYNKWLSDVKENFSEQINKNDITLLGIDFKRYFYNIDEALDKFDIKLDYKYENIYQLFSSILRKIYKKYTNELKPCLNEIKCYDYILPIGLSSSKILSNYVLKELDKSFLGMDDLIYYGRYVDDVIFLFKNKKDSKELIEHIESTIKETKESKNLKLNKEKINYQCYPKGTSERNLHSFLDNTNPSSAYNNDFDFSASYNLLFDLERKMIKDNLNTGHMTPEKFYSLNAKNFLLIWNFLLNGERLDPLDVKKIDGRIFSEIDYKTNGFFINLAVKFFKTRKNNMTSKYYEKLFSQLKLDFKDIAFDENDHKDSPHFLKEKVIDFYERKINLCFITNEVFLNNSINSELTYKALKGSGFIRLSPITNYLIDELLTKKDICYQSSKEYFGNSLQFVHFHDLKIHSDLTKIFFNDKITYFNKDYYQINNLEQKTFYNIKTKTNVFNGVKYQSTEISMESKDKTNNKNNKGLENKFVVSQPNINLNYEKGKFEELFDTPSLEETFIFYRILNEAKRNKTNLIVFPEFYIKLNWLSNLASFCRNEQIDTIFGLQPFRVKNNYYVNLLGSIYSSDNHSNKVSFPLLRIKNNYSHVEIKDFSPVLKPNKKTYINVRKNNYSSTGLLCFEATDIFARAIFKGKTDLVAIPMLNRDTTYFNNVIESLSRDLSVIVVSSNSFKDGNSVIVQPTETYRRIITEFKGGFNNYLVSSKISINKLIRYNKCPDNFKKDFKPHPASYKNQ